MPSCFLTDLRWALQKPNGLRARFPLDSEDAATLADHLATWLDHAGWCTTELSDESLFHVFVCSDRRATDGPETNAIPANMPGASGKAQ